MWPEGQWEASKKITWKGTDRVIDTYINKLTSQLYERIGQGPILWKFNHICDPHLNQESFRTKFTKTIFIWPYLSYNTILHPFLEQIISPSLNHLKSPKCRSASLKNSELEEKLCISESPGATNVRVALTWLLAVLMRDQSVVRCRYYSHGYQLDWSENDLSSEPSNTIVFP